MDGSLNSNKLNNENKVGPFSYALNTKDRKFIVTPPIYFSWDFIEENFNKYNRVNIPTAIKSFRKNEKGDLILEDKEIIDS